MSQNYYVYTHSTNAHGIFYVGKGNETRIKKITREHNPQHCKIVRKCGTDNVIVKSILCKSEQHALNLEARMIAALRQGGAKLVNLNNGNCETKQWDNFISINYRHADNSRHTVQIEQFYIDALIAIGITDISKFVAENAGVTTVTKNVKRSIVNELVKRGVEQTTAPVLRPSK
ncbi:MAG: hypothetical protein PHN45_07325 [Methylococcales bacterium]|nr:hypothetical protein [Methylococcales bacterium]MDD5754546.1 hypothetical protein [Methylococcales bacterium]